MASVRWKGGAQAVAQVTTVQVTAYHASTTYRLTVNGKTVSASGGGTVNAVATALAAAWNASTEPELAEVTASANTDTVTLTADTPGVPFTVTSSVSGGSGTIGSATTATASAGPNDWSTAANWSGGAVPVNSDDVYLDHSDDDILYGLSQSAVTLTSLTIAASYTGLIGLPETNEEGTSSYAEYRQRYLAIGATTVTVGEGPGQGSPRLLLDTGSAQTALRVHGTGFSAEPDLGALRWKGTHADNTVTVTRGSVDVATLGGEAATVATLTVGYQTSQASDAVVRCGAGVTLTTLAQTGGAVELNSGLTTVTKTGGTLVLNAGSVTTLTNDDGDLVYSGTGTIGTLTVGTDAAADFSRGVGGCTVTNCTLHPGSSLLDPGARVTFTNPFRVSRASLREVTLDVGVNRTYAVSS